MNEVNLGLNEYADLVFDITYDVEGGEWEDHMSEEHRIVMPILTCFKQADLFDIKIDLAEKYWKIFAELYTFRGTYIGHPIITSWLDDCSVKSARVISRWSIYVPDYSIESAYQRRRFALLWG